VFVGKEGERKKLNWTWEGWSDVECGIFLRVLIDGLIPKM
jgi:hypothetical protein